MAGLGYKGRRLKYIEAGVKRGYSTRRIQDMLIEAKLGVRRSVMLKEIRGMRGVRKKAEAIRFVRKDYRPSRATFARPWFNQKAPYMYKFRITLMDEYRNVINKFPQAYSMKEIESIGKVEEYLMKKFKDIYAPNVDIEIVTGWRKY